VSPETMLKQVQHRGSGIHNSDDDSNAVDQKIKIEFEKLTYNSNDGHSPSLLVAK
jgi:hypothetical protein